MEAARVHHPARRRGCVAACSAGAAAGDPGDRVSGPEIARCDLGTAARVSSGETIAELAREYDCGVATIRRALAGMNK
jgi:hypothetical protein